MEEGLVGSGLSSKMSLTIGDISRTATMKEDWVVGEQIAVFAKVKNTDDTVQRHSYTVTEIDYEVSLQPDDYVTALSNIDYDEIWAFYPYDTDTTTLKQYQSRIEDNFYYGSDVDYLYFNKKNHTASKALTITFAHELSRVSFNITAGLEYTTDQLPTEGKLYGVADTAIVLNFVVDGTTTSDAVFVLGNEDIASAYLEYYFDGVAHVCNDLNKDAEGHTIDYWAVGTPYYYSYRHGSGYTTDFELSNEWVLDDEFPSKYERTAMLDELTSATLATNRDIVLKMPYAYRLDSITFAYQTALKELHLNRIHTLDPSVIAGTSIEVLDISGVAFYTDDDFSSFSNSVNCDLRININKYEKHLDTYVDNVWQNATWRSITYVDHQGKEMSESDIFFTYLEDITSNFVIPANSTIILRDASGTTGSTLGSTLYSTELALLKTAVNASSGVNLIFLDFSHSVYSSTFKAYTGCESFSGAGFTFLRSSGVFQNNTNLKSLYLPRVYAPLSNSYSGCTSLTDFCGQDFDPSTGNCAGAFASCSSLKYLNLPSATYQGRLTTFSNCTSLQEIWFTADNFFFDDTQTTAFSGTTTENIRLVLGANHAVADIDGVYATGDEGTIYTFRQIDVLSE